MSLNCRKFGLRLFVSPVAALHADHNCHGRFQLLKLWDRDVQEDEF
jgi:hypothetical protein